MTAPGLLVTSSSVTLLIWAGALGTAGKPLATVSPTIRRQIVFVASVPDTLAVGEVVESVTSPTDPSQSFALYLPATYEPSKRWPILFLLDPRGRALVPLQLFREAADRHGYILISSYNTVSDESDATERNERALSAMLEDSQRWFSLDPNRLYLAGFSGTARGSWILASGLRGHVAGVIGVGAGIPAGHSLFEYLVMADEAPFAFFGTSGTIDFNYEEMRELDARLDEFDVPHRFTYFAGSHSWPPKHVCSRAVDWMELQAVRSGLRPADTALVDELFARGLEIARSLEEEGRLLASLREYRDLAEDFGGLHDISEPLLRAAELEKERIVEEALEKQRKLSRDWQEYVERLTEYLTKINDSDDPPAQAERAVRELELTELRERAEMAEDTLEAQAAQRLLEITFLHTSFYVPRRYMEQGDAERALASLTIAEAARPESPRLCYQRARAYALAQRDEQALDALECLLDAGVALSPSNLERDEYLQTLSGNPRFQELLERARQ